VVSRTLKGGKGHRGFPYPERLEFTEDKKRHEVAQDGKAIRMKVSAETGKPFGLDALLLMFHKDHEKKPKKKKKARLVGTMTRVIVHHRDANPKKRSDGNSMRK